jgi:hypothetical protein
MTLVLLILLTLPSNWQQTLSEQGCHRCDLKCHLKRNL